VRYTCRRRDASQSSFAGAKRSPSFPNTSGDPEQEYVADSMTEDVRPDLLRHGTLMLFFVAMPLVVGLMTFAVPLQPGVCDLAFPVLNSVSSWLTAVGALLVNVSLVVGNFAPHRVDGSSTAVRARVFP
jgi:hypothetical protein